MPPIREIENLTDPAPQVYELSNGVKVYDTNMGALDIVKLELVFFAGRPFEEKKLASRVTAALLREGTLTRSSADIAEELDFYGGTLSTPSGMDTSGVLLYSLTKHFDKLLALVADMLTEPVFPQKELEAFTERNKRRLQVDLTKNDVVAYRKITEMFFGSEHPYGFNSLPETYDALTREDLLAHFYRTYTCGNCMIFVSGKTGEPVRQLLEKHLGKAIRPGERCAPSPNIYRDSTTDRSPQILNSPLPNSVQTAIRIGSPLFARKHPDFTGMYILNTILGGYFGSRLMANIREKKGFTYNIYSSHDAMLYDGMFYVGTEVGNLFVEPTLREIYREMARLTEKTVGKAEMTMVRNYLLGNLLTSLDGAFNVAEVIKAFAIEDLPVNAFDEMVHDIKTITPKALKALAIKYFQKEKMWEVVV